MIKNITIDNLKEEEKNLYYMNKYMKYKSKYIELKNISNQNILNQKGGSYFYEQNENVFFEIFRGAKKNIFSVGRPCVAPPAPP